ncbi:MAG: hypothetical protein GF364_13810 [Candidatus Lokiarchaeota archaeon]|nr:hypothetical protein [Candidatus Lokiarchaeota archaeon]
MFDIFYKIDKEVNFLRSYIGNIPAEIYEAFEQKDYGYSLLVKGNAGVGKSTFAFTLLSSLSNIEPIYISTRVAPNSLYSQFPLIKEKLKEENILDATRTYIPPVDSSKKLKTHLLRTIRFADTPEFLKIVYDKVEECNNPVIVIDSWDAVIGSNSRDKIQEWETMLTEFVRQLKIKLLLITETSDKSFLDYIVDSIITLVDAETNGRTLREVTINKVRGIERRQKRYTFTLYNNEFKYCNAYFQPSMVLNSKHYKSKSWNVIRSENENRFSTGNSEIDRLYHGGLRTSTLNLWEIESNVPLSAGSEIFLRMVCNFVSQGLGTIIYSMDGVNSRFIDKNKLFFHLSMEDIGANIRYMVEDIPNVKDKTEIRPYVKKFQLKNFVETFADTYTFLAEKTSFKPVLSIISYDFLKFMGDASDISNEIYNQLKFVRNYNIIEIGIVNQLSNVTHAPDISPVRRNFSLENISYFFDTHMKMIYNNNAIFIYGIKPCSGMYWLKFINDPSDLMHRIELIPMV